MIEIDAPVYTLAAKSALYREVDGGRYEWIHPEIGKRCEFVKQSDYEKALKEIIRLRELYETMTGTKRPAYHDVGVER